MEAAFWIVIGVAIMSVAVVLYFSDPGDDEEY